MIYSERFNGRLGIRSKARGFAFIELILVLVVIALLSGWYFNRGENPHQEAASQYQQSMDRSKSTACVAGRSAMRSAVLTYTMQNPGKPVTKEALQQSGMNMNICPENGEITVSPDGTILCSLHQP